MPTTDELRDLLMLNGMLNADAKDVNSKLIPDTVGKMGLRGINPKEMLTRVGGQQAIEKVVPPPPTPTIQVAGVDGAFNITAPAPLIPMADISPDILQKVIGNQLPPTVPQQASLVITKESQKSEPSPQQEFGFIDKLGKRPPIEQQILEHVQNIEYRVTSIDIRLKRIEEHFERKNKKKVAT